MLEVGKMGCSVRNVYMLTCILFCLKHVTQLDLHAENPLGGMDFLKEQ